MNAEELAAIPVWVEREVTKRRIPSLFAELSATIQNNANGSRQAFEPQRTQLIEAVQDVDLNALTDSQADFLREKLKLLSHLGSEGAEEIEGILFRNSLDVATASSEMSRISGEVQSAIDRSNNIRTALSGLVSPYEMPDDQVLVRVVFDNSASIGDVVDFKKWAAEWHDIGRGIAMAAGSTPRDLRVVGAQTGSIIITLATTVAIAKVISTILLNALQVAEKVQALRKAELEIQALKLSNAKAVEALKEQVVTERELGLNAIADSVSAGMRLDGEKISALQKSINKLLGFIEKGGEVDVVLPIHMRQDVEDLGEDAQALTQNVARIHELERDARLITYISKEGDQEETSQN